MCGIFGLLTDNYSNYSDETIKKIIDTLFTLSESRGKEASGLAIKKDNKIFVFKQPIPASKLIKSKKYKELIQQSLSTDGNTIDNKGNSSSLAIIGQSRLVTDGIQDLNVNNQPIIKDGAVAIHNGIIVNTGELWGRFTNMQRIYEVDTEVILSMLQMFRKEKKSIITAAQETFFHIEGSASIGVLFNDNNQLLLATNTGSLYIALNQSNTLCAFASEKYILSQLISDRTLKKLWEGSTIIQVKHGSGYIVNISNLELNPFSLTIKDDSAQVIGEIVNNPVDIMDLSDAGTDSAFNSDPRRPRVNIGNKKRILNEIARQPRPEVDLRRCTKCILPETFPFIEFDDEGVCNYCRNYKKNIVKGPNVLDDLVSKYRSQNGEPDCLIGLSGGRDSSYGLHYIKNVLKMNPIAFTYDWGMVTDLARRNMSRICSKLGVEHIIVSADITKKRENIRKNIEAWLKKPELGMVPLFMAGDKQFLYYAHEVMKQTNVKLVFGCFTSLEKTDFKTGFCGIREGDTKGKVLTGHSLSTKLKLISYYMKQYLFNPAYINSSMMDTMSAYYSTYILPDAHTYIYGYIPWDEQHIVSTLREEYNWEFATDTTATWRIGDGTAPFYNYIYHTVAGFSEFDTFRSNQIREGMITRDEALKLVQEENMPRYESLEWYAQTIGFNLEDAIDVIHSIPKTYISVKR